MNKSISQVFSLTLFAALFSCASGVSQKSTSSKSTIQEDLSQFRPKYEKDTSAATVVIPEETPVGATADVSAQINKKLDEIAVNSPTSAKGFRVMLYSGNSKDEATMVKEKAHILTKEKVYIEYRAPNFRVKAGDAINRLEANYLYGELKNDFPNAVIVPDNININY